MWTHNEVSGLMNVSIASDIVILYHKTLIHSSTIILDAANINPSLLTLIGRGALLFQLMELDKTEIDDIETEAIQFLTKSANA